MRIAYVEIANFRKLLSVRIDFADETTLLVGANNSGKTSAMLALRYFLTEKGPGRFCLNDFTLSNWTALDLIGESWKENKGKAESPESQLTKWHETAPTLDLWMDVEDGEIHRVSDFIPSLDWAGGRLGIRLRFQPTNVEALWKEFIAASETIDKLRSAGTTDVSDKNSVARLWPDNMTGFLETKLQSYFAVKAYALDPSKVQDPENGIARLQNIPVDQEPIDTASLKALIRIDEINAQRIFGDEADGGDGLKQDARSARQLSLQLRNYYKRHLDPFTDPDPSDLDALAAIERAQKAFDQRLADGFKEALKEVEGLGYPGVTDPRITISTRLKPVEGLDHDTAVRYEIESVSGGGAIAPVLRLPESFNGLGYQNLISMVFRLMSFRDAWMRVGKAGKGKEVGREMAPLHLVLVEEPEAHLHAQVQQVFIQRAYRILREHKDLLTNRALHTQLVVSTHSSHIAHEVDFSCLRYFRRLPAGLRASIPVSKVINLSRVFGNETDTKRFVTRYLKAQHCDLFFADAAILVEGPAERMLVPHFIRNQYTRLGERYITILEIGGSHAHRLRPLIDELELLTLIITDLDAADSGGKAAQPKRGTVQTTTNDTLRKWHPKLETIDELCDLVVDKKICTGNDTSFAVRVAYQIPLTVAFGSGTTEEVVPNTFEDALVFDNLEFVAQLDGAGLVRKFKDAIASCTSTNALGKEMFDNLKTGKKADFALDVIDAKEFDSIKVPVYIAEGLEWLQSRLVKISAADSEATGTAGILI